LIRHQRSGIRNQIAIRNAVPLMQKVRVGLSRTWRVSLRWGQVFSVACYLFPDL